jgi:hypothetical protein
MQEHQIDRARASFAVLACASLLSGLAIFLFVHSGFLRYYGGDIVAITFLYSLAVLLFRSKPLIVATGVMAVAPFIEILQAVLSLPYSAVLDLTLGRTFDPLDILIYLGSTCMMAALHFLLSKRLSRYEKTSLVKIPDGLRNGRDYCCSAITR